MICKFTIFKLYKYLQVFTNENSSNNRPRLQYSSNMRKRTQISKISQERLRQEETGPQDLRQVGRGLQGRAPSMDGFRQVVVMIWAG